MLVHVNHIMSPCNCKWLSLLPLHCFLQALRMAQASTKKKRRTAAETSHVVAVPSSSLEKSKVEEWLINIMKEEGQEIEYSNPKIQKVKHTLRQSNPGYFDPSVVSFGMHHHDKTSHRFSEMKRYKKVTARWFISLAAKTSNKLGLAAQVHQPVTRLLLWPKLCTTNLSTR